MWSYWNKRLYIQSVKDVQSFRAETPNYYRWKRQRDKGIVKRKQELYEIKNIEKEH